MEIDKSLLETDYAEITPVLGGVYLVREDDEDHITMYTFNRSFNILHGNRVGENIDVEYGTIIKELNVKLVQA